MRKSGILLHISSLPGPGGIGSLGAEAYAFADFLASAGMKVWQVLPMGPTGFGESPYQSSSVYAGNPLLISTELMRQKGLVDYADDELYVPASEGKVDYAAVRENKDMLLRRAFAQSEQKMLPQIRQFLRENRWAESFALFTAIKLHFGNQMWSQWPDKGIRTRKPDVLIRYRVELDDEVRYHVFCQYIFRQQWTAFKAYCNSKGIELFGDMPIYVAEDSADAWTNPEVFQMDRNLVPSRVAGVPPDYFSADGQRWGNPLYRWNYLALHGYDWWVNRMRAMADMYDVIRVDHFIGFANYYSIPYDEKTARNGKWVVGPGKKLFQVLKWRVPKLKLVAEDLGEVNNRVRSLLKFTKYPGMRVMTFGFDGDDSNIHFPKNYSKNCVAYTGTHDNDTVLGWIKNSKWQPLKKAQTTLRFHKHVDGPDAFIRGLMASNADTVVIPMQDVLGLDSPARMNKPGTIGGNWVWRLMPDLTTPELAARLKELVISNDRGNTVYEDYHDEENDAVEEDVIEEAAAADDGEGAAPADGDAAADQ